MQKGRALALVALSTLAVVVSATVAGAAIQPVKRYTIPLPGSGYDTKRLLSVGDTVPMTGNPAKQYQMVGIPDGTGAHRNSNGTRTIFMNHELPVSPTVATSQPIIGDPLNRGAIVSKLVVDRRGNVLTGDRAYDFVYDESLPSPVAQPAAGREQHDAAVLALLLGDARRAAGRLRPLDLHAERGGGNRVEHLRRQGRRRGRGLRQRAPHAAEDGPLRLGEHGSAAEQPGQSHDRHGTRGRPVRRRPRAGEQPALHVRRLGRTGAPARAC